MLKFKYLNYSKYTEQTLVLGYNVSVLLTVSTKTPQTSDATSSVRRYTQLQQTLVKMPSAIR